MKTFNTDHFNRKGPDHEYAQDKEKDPTCFITMSPIWASLPRELVNKILDDHITNHLPPPPVSPQKGSDEGPNSTFYAWLTLRNSFNSAIRRRIEGYYRTYMLTQLHLALYTHRPDSELISDEDRMGWAQLDWPPVAECNMDGDDKLTLFHWPGWGPYRYEGALEIYEPQQAQEKATGCRALAELCRGFGVPFGRQQGY